MYSVHYQYINIVVTCVLWFGDSKASPTCGCGVEHKCEGEVWIQDTPEEVHRGLVVQSSFPGSGCAMADMGCGSYCNFKCA